MWYDKTGIQVLDRILNAVDQAREELEKEGVEAAPEQVLSRAADILLYEYEGDISERTRQRYATFLRSLRWLLFD